MSDRDDADAHIDEETSTVEEMRAMIFTLTAQLVFHGMDRDARAVGTSMARFPSRDPWCVE
jgi:hypothetical protein